MAYFRHIYCFEASINLPKWIYPYGINSSEQMNNPTQIATEASVFCENLKWFCMTASQVKDWFIKINTSTHAMCSIRNIYPNEKFSLPLPPHPILFSWLKGVLCNILKLFGIFQSYPKFPQQVCHTMNQASFFISDFCLHFLWPRT